MVDHLEGWATNSDGKPYAVLLGDSGSGKTTAAKVLNNRLNAAYRENLESSDTNNPAARLSIYLDLRKADLDERESPELNRLIDNVMERTWEVEAARTITAKVILDQVRNQGAVLIFDGLDEVLVRINEKRGREFVQQLWRALPPDLARDPNRNSGRLLMTCRTHYFPTIDSERSFFGGEDRAAGVSTLYEALHLLPFTEAQILAWVSACRPGNGQARRLTHGQVLLQTVARERELHLSGRDVTLSLQPMGQASGFVLGALAPLAQGAAVVTLPSFDAADVAQALVRHRVTRLLLAAPP